MLRQARRLFANEQNQVWPAIIDLYQAILRYQQGRYPDAQRLFRQAARLLSNSLMDGKAALCKLLQAQLLWKEGTPIKLARHAATFCGIWILTRAPSLRFHVNFVLGQVEEQLENWEGAWNAYQDARQEIENLRSRLWGDELKISILKDKLAVYEALVWLALCESAAHESRSPRTRSCWCDRPSRGAWRIRSHFPWLSAAGKYRQRRKRVQEIRRDLNWHYRQIELAALLVRSGLPGRLDLAKTGPRAGGPAGSQLERTARLPARDSLKTTGSWIRSGTRSGRASRRTRFCSNTTKCAAWCMSACSTRTSCGSCLWPRPPSCANRFGCSQFSSISSGSVRSTGERFKRGCWRLRWRISRSCTAELIAPIRSLLRRRHLIIAPHAFLHNSAVSCAAHQGPVSAG